MEIERGDAYAFSSGFGCRAGFTEQMIGWSNEYRTFIKLLLKEHWANPAKAGDAKP